jgi:hypothetical protein
MSRSRRHSSFVATGRAQILVPAGEDVGVEVEFVQSSAGGLIDDLCDRPSTPADESLAGKSHDHLSDDVELDLSGAAADQFQGYSQIWFDDRRLGLLY